MVACRGGRSDIRPQSSSLTARAVQCTAQRRPCILGGAVLAARAGDQGHGGAGGRRVTAVQVRLGEATDRPAEGTAAGDRSAAEVDQGGGEIIRGSLQC